MVLRYTHQRIEMYREKPTQRATLERNWCVYNGRRMSVRYSACSALNVLTTLESDVCTTDDVFQHVIYCVLYSMFWQRCTVTDVCTMDDVRQCVTYRVMTTLADLSHITLKVQLQEKQKCQYGTLLLLPSLPSLCAHCPFPVPGFCPQIQLGSLLEHSEPHSVSGMTSSFLMHSELKITLHVIVLLHKFSVFRSLLGRYWSQCISNKLVWCNVVVWFQAELSDQWSAGMANSRIPGYRHISKWYQYRYRSHSIPVWSVLTLSSQSQAVHHSVCLINGHSLVTSHYSALSPATAASAC